MKQKIKTIIEIWCIFVCFRMLYMLFFDTPKLPITSVILSPMWEELVFRSYMIGFLAFIAHGPGGVKLFQYLNGGDMKLDSKSIRILIVSSAVFSLFHLNSGMGSIAFTFICGYAMGYIFIRFGLKYSILLHFMLNITEFGFPYIVHFWWPLGALIAIVCLIVAVKNVERYAYCGLGAIKYKGGEISCREEENSKGDLDTMLQEPEAGSSRNTQA